MERIRKLLNQLLCRIQGHKKGKRVLMVSVSTTAAVNTFACPRCGAQWTRKAKA